MIVKSDSDISSARLLSAFALGCAFFAYGFVHRVAPSVMTGELMRDFSVGGSALGSLSAMYFYAYVVLQIPVGLLMDRYGPRKLMTAALLLCAIASVSMAISTTIWAASVSRLIIGGSVAFAFVGTLTILTRWLVPRRFALFAALLQSSGMLGAMLGQAPLRVAVEHYQWRSTLLGLGIAGLVLAIAAIFTIPKRSKTLSASTPATVHGGLQAQSAGIASMVFMGWLLVAPFIGWLSDRLGRRKPVLVTGSIVSLAVLYLILNMPLQSPLLMGALFFLQGAGGCSMVVCFSVIREYNPHGNTSAALGMMNTFVVGAGAVMQPLIGFALDSQWQGKSIDGARIYQAINYDQAFLLLLAANIMAVLCCTLLKETRT